MAYDNLSRATRQNKREIVVFVFLLSLISLLDEPLRELPGFGRLSEEIQPELVSYIICGILIYLLISYYIAALDDYNNPLPHIVEGERLRKEHELKEQASNLRNAIEQYYRTVVTNDLYDSHESQYEQSIFRTMNLIDERINMLRDTLSEDLRNYQKHQPVHRFTHEIFNIIEESTDKITEIKFDYNQVFHFLVTPVDDYRRAKDQMADHSNSALALSKARKVYDLALPGILSIAAIAIMFYSIYRG